MHPPAFKSALLAALLFPSLFAFSSPQGGRHRAVAVSTPLDDLAISVVQVTVPGTDALLDAGTIRNQTQRGSRSTTRRAFGLRIGRPSSGSRGQVALHAFVRNADTSCTIRLDGKTLGPAATLIDPRAPVGLVTQHLLEIEVPITAPEGALDVTIGFEAVKNR